MQTKEKKQSVEQKEEFDILLNPFIPCFPSAPFPFLMARVSNQ
jgi:hypothetical protein